MRGRRASATIWFDEPAIGWPSKPMTVSDGRSHSRSYTTRPDRRRGATPSRRRSAARTAVLVAGSAASRARSSRLGGADVVPEAVERRCRRARRPACEQLARGPAPGRAPRRRPCPLCTGPSSARTVDVDAGEAPQRVGEAGRADRSSCRRRPAPARRRRSSSRCASRNGPRWASRSPPRPRRAPSRCTAARRPREPGAHRRERGPRRPPCRRRCPGRTAGRRRARGSNGSPVQWSTTPGGCTSWCA